MAVASFTFRIIWRAPSSIRKFWRCIPLILLAEVYARMGVYEQSVAQIKQSMQRPALVEGSADVLLAYASAMSGRRKQALNLTQRIRKHSDPQHLDYALAVIYAALGEKDQAFARLEGALHSHDFSLVLLQADYRLENLRSGPRYKAFLRRMNLLP